MRSTLITASHQLVIVDRQLYITTTTTTVIMHKSVESPAKTYA